MEYNFGEIERKWQKHWADNKTFAADNNSSKEKYYVLDMFPYPSGAGLHVGHPLGYIASDIVSRYKRHQGFNVLHPMGYDSFGLPAEQYAIQTGQHPAITTEKNIARYREQLDKIGFSFDWDREVRTSDPDYYKWTQWIFIKLFNSWYNPKTNKAESIDTLIPQLKNFSSLSEKEKSDLLMEYRLAYLSEAWVNWCPQLGTVLANEEVKDGVSERGGYPVERKLMPQWSLRITAYADRLLNDLDAIEWSESIKEAQRNWIGKSEGSSLQFTINNSPLTIEVFTTRPDTIFGVSFVTLAPEHELIEKITPASHKDAVAKYVDYAKNRSERERMADVKKITGQFTGAYVVHPFTQKEIPVWIGEYVLAGYGTGAVMGVPAHDSRDFAFAKHFDLERPVVILPNVDWDFENQSYDEKDGKCVNSDFLNGLEVKAAIKKCIEEIEKKNLGKGKTNYRLRDAIFGRQRYWGEPIPVYYKDGIPHTMEERDLPLVLPEVDKYLPTETGEPPLARAASSWKHEGKYEYEKTTMPGWAGSSWYYLRYMDANNKNEFVSKEAANYWQNVDLYIGGSEHATGHLLYVRFWTKFLHDLGYIPVIEPAKKLINQGMIQGVSKMFFRLDSERYVFARLVRALRKRNIVFETEKQIEGKYVDVFIPQMNLIVEIKNYDSKDISAMAEQQKFFINKGFRFVLIHIDEVIKSAKKIAEMLSSADIMQNTNIELSKSKKKKSTWIIPFEKASNKNLFPGQELYIDVNIVNNDEILLSDLRQWRDEYNNTKIYPQKGKLYKAFSLVEKMSKSKLNVVTPDDIIEKHGADCLRLYEMFLGPLEQSKPWNTNGISGVSNFLRKLWRLFHKPQTSNIEPQTDSFFVSDEQPTREELKILHKTIKKVTEDIDRFSFNTSVSSFMICVNELTDLKCNKRAVLEPLCILISPYAPHIAEQLWSKLGHTTSISTAPFPKVSEEYLTEDSFEYPVSVNGKTRFKINYALNKSKEEIEKEIVLLEELHKYLNGSSPKKVIVVPGRIINVVV